MSCLHFEDIDAGGFWIHHNLCEITGVKFELFGMSVDELKNEENVFCLQKVVNKKFDCPKNCYKNYSSATATSEGRGGNALF